MFTPGLLVHTTTDKTYKYVKYVGDSVAAVAGAVAYWSDDDTSFTDGMVTADYSECMTDTLNDIRGVFVNAPTAGYYTFIQTWGYHAALVTDGGTDFAKGDWVTGKGDLTTERIAGNAAQTSRVLAICAAAYSASTVPGYIIVEK
jgi:hypothetical protein